MNVDTVINFAKKKTVYILGEKKGKKGQCIHILWCIFKSNITMIAKVCDRESRRNLWFENRLV